MDKQKVLDIIQIWSFVHAPKSTQVDDTIDDCQSKINEMTIASLQNNDKMDAEEGEDVPQFVKFNSRFDKLRVDCSMLSPISERSECISNEDLLSPPPVMNDEHTDTSYTVKRELLFNFPAPKENNWTQVASNKEYPDKPLSSDENPARSSQTQVHQVKSAKTEENAPTKEHSVEFVKPKENPVVKEQQIKSVTSKEHQMESVPNKEYQVESTAKEELLLEPSTLEEHPMECATNVEYPVQSSTIEKHVVKSETNENHPAEYASSEEHSLKHTTTKEHLIESVKTEERPKLRNVQSNIFLLKDIHQWNPFQQFITQ